MDRAQAYRLASRHLEQLKAARRHLRRGEANLMEGLAAMMGTGYIAIPTNGEPLEFKSPPELGPVLDVVKEYLNALDKQISDEESNLQKL